jgi:dTDP-4-dehydrorhamnose 3,5-epimerase-like enzyme
MIEGVETKDLRPIADDRGFLMEILRSDDPMFRSFGQAYITGCKFGVAKAWHYHKEQSDHFACVSEKRWSSFTISAKTVPHSARRVNLCLKRRPAKKGL